MLATVYEVIEWTTLFGALHESAIGPTRKYAAAQQVVGYLGYTGRAVNVIARAAHDPQATFARSSSCTASEPQLFGLGLQADQLLRERSYPIGVGAGPPDFHPHVAAIGPTQVRKPLRERGEVRLRKNGIVFVPRHEHADAPHIRCRAQPRMAPSRQAERRRRGTTA